MSRFFRIVIIVLSLSTPTKFAYSGLSDWWRLCGDKLCNCSKVQLSAMLHEVLEPRGRVNESENTATRHDGVLGDYVAYNAGRENETMLVIRNAKIDPDLAGFLREAQTVAKPEISEHRKAIAIAQLVMSKMQGTCSGLLAPINRRRYEQRIRRGGYIRLGDFLRHGVGTCAPRAVAVQVALETIGVVSRIAIGELTAIENGKQIYQGLHAWNEVYFGNDTSIVAYRDTWRLLDASGARDPQFGLSSGGKEPKGSYVRHSLVADGMRFEYQNKEDGFWLNRTIDLDTRDIPSIVNSIKAEE